MNDHNDQRGFPVQLMRAFQSSCNELFSGRSISRIACLWALIGPALLAEAQYQITPDSGPAIGGTEVTITGRFFADSLWHVSFGLEPRVPARRVDAQTLRAVTPPNFPGPKSLVLHGDNANLYTNIAFDYLGQPENVTRIMLPIFTRTVYGPFGSAFGLWSVALNDGEEVMRIYGIGNREVSDPVDLPPHTGHHLDTIHGGNPGRFLYIRNDQIAALSINLMVRDFGHQPKTYGTEIPIIRDGEFINNRVVLYPVPTEPGFRNTLRVYSPFDTTVRVSVTNEPPFLLRLTGAGLFHPAYGVVTSFPVYPEGHLVRVAVEVVPEAGQPVDIPIWAFITNTNNETQSISTITPQP